MSLSRRTTLGSTSGYDAYKSNEITTVSQGKLIVMLYEGACLLYTSDAADE